MRQVQSFLAKGGQIFSLQETRQAKVKNWGSGQTSSAHPLPKGTLLLANAGICQEYQWKAISSLLQPFLVLQKDNTQGKWLVHFVSLRKAKHQAHLRAIIRKHQSKL